MLYITTRDPADSFTAHRVLREDRASDGGMFLPMQMPALSKERILALKDASFGEAVAQVLNLFFDKPITGWDVEFSVGRNPVKLSGMNHRLTVARLWHNRSENYQRFEKAIYEMLIDGIAPQKDIPQWPRIAIRIAVLFGIYGQLCRRGINAFDIAMSDEDFLLPVAVWYAQNMGLPVGTVICGCDESSGIWDLIHRGEFNMAAAAIGIERLIFDAFGREECKRYLAVCRRNGLYKITQDQRMTLSRRLFAAVASTGRMESIIKSVYRTNDFILDPGTAVAYGALQDYRAKRGEGKATLILADKSPVLSSRVIQKVLGLSAEELRTKLNAQKE